MKVLVVDDNEEARYLLERLLTGSGYEVATAVNGKEALSKLKSDRFHLIVSDILMPEMDGFQLLKYVNDDAELRKIPFVFYTATYTDDRDAELGYKLGADKYLRKPLEPEELLKILQKILTEAASGKLKAKKPAIEEKEEIFKLYSERLVKKLEKKMLALEKEIVERKQVEEDLLKLKKAAEASGEVIFLTDRDGVFTYVNPEFTRLYGYSAEEVVGKETPRILKSGKTTAREYKVFWETLLNGRVYRAEFINKAKDGRRIPVAVSTNPIIDKCEGIIGFASIQRDITGRRKAQKALERALQQAQQANRVKTLFLANMSHEIRTPLNSILGYCDLAEQSVSHLIGPEERTFFDTIHRSGGRLIRTIHEILDISQIEAGVFNLQPKPLPLAELAEQIVHDLRPLAEKKGLALNYHTTVEPAIIEADENCITQALTNVIDNAIKYTEEGQIDVDLTEQDDGLHLTVRDTGIGMSAEYQEQLFEVFSQESTGYTKRFQGVGLGLALTKRYLDMSQAKIDIQSTQGVGTKVIFTFKPREA
jgi:PAS domain S-box-containing protein